MRMYVLKKTVLVVLAAATLSGVASIANASVTSPRDSFTDGSHVTDTRDPFSDGSRAAGKYDASTDDL